MRIQRQTHHNTLRAQPAGYQANNAGNVNTQRYISVGINGIDPAENSLRTGILPAGATGTVIETEGSEPECMK